MTDQPGMMESVQVRKRRRELEDDLPEHADKKSRQMFSTPTPFTGVEPLWQPKDALSSPSRSFHSQRDKYDSDDQDSMASEPGSPQAMSDAEDDDVSMADSDGEPSSLPKPSAAGAAHPLQTPWKTRTANGNRIPTPIVRPGASPIQTHIRSRHPQEVSSSQPGVQQQDRLEVPSPIDEDEVPTPPSAAEAAGSQLEMLRVTDEMQTDDPERAEDSIPQISISRTRSPQPFEMGMGSPTGPVKLRKRSGALSAGQSSPMRATPEPAFGGAMSGMSGSGLANGDIGPPGGESSAFAAKRGISMGYRHDCEKCRMRVPGHMNHFY